MTMAWRATLKMRRNFEQFFDVTIQPLLFTAMFACIFGGAISGGVEDYLPMLIPGLIAQTVLTACVATGIQLREDMDKGVFDRFKVLPISRIAPLAGPMVADMIRYASRRRSPSPPASLMGYRPGGGVPGVLAAIVLAIIAGWSLAWIFTWFGTVGRSAQAVQGYSLMVMFPLTFLSNAFVPADTLPPTGCRPSPSSTRSPTSSPRCATWPTRAGHRRGRLGAAGLSRRDRGLRPAVGAELHPEDVVTRRSRSLGLLDEIGRPAGRRTPPPARRGGPGRRVRRARARGVQAITGKLRL